WSSAGPASATCSRIWPSARRQSFPDSVVAAAPGRPASALPLSIACLVSALPLAYPASSLPLSLACLPWSCHLDFFAAGLVDAHALVALDLDAHAIRLAGLGVVDRHVGLVDRHRFLDDAAGRALERIRLGVLLHQVDAFNDQVIVVLAQLHLAALALVTAREHDDFVAFANLVHDSSSYRTSGASDTIFMNFSVRSSRVTGPKMRVPIGSSLLLSSTAALPSNLTSEPSERRMPLAVRTT